MVQRVDIQYVRFYTQGSAAKKVAPAISVHTGALPQIKKRKVQRIFVDPVALLSIAVAVGMLIMILVGVSGLRVQQEKTAAMISYVEQLRQENEALHTRYDEECDLEKIEETARALGMIPRVEANRTAISVELPPVQEKPA